MSSLPVFRLFFISGAAGLVYELVWVRELVFVFGGTTYAITTVLVAFMAGLGLGSYLAGRIAQRFARPGFVYAALEMAIGLYALLVPLLLRWLEPAYRVLYAQLADSPWLLNVVRFALSAAVLLIPTTCMGATLPILVRHITLEGGKTGRSVGLLYGINTAGAVVGTLAAGFWLLPWLGLLHTTWTAAAANIGIGLFAALVLKTMPGNAVARRPKPAAVKPVPAASDRGAGAAALPTLAPAWRALALVGFGISGFAAMVYQITWTRALVLLVGSST